MPLPLRSGSLTARAAYRVSQFFGALSALMRPADESPAEKILSAVQMTLFRKMSRVDRAHALRVLAALQREGHREEALLQAALLHDVGKAGGIPLLYRPLIVLARAAGEGLPRRLAAIGEREHPMQPFLRPFLHPFLINEEHPRIGAEMAKEAGSPALTTALILHHHEGIPETGILAGREELLDALRRADGAN